MAHGYCARTAMVINALEQALQGQSASNLMILLLCHRTLKKADSQHDTRRCIALRCPHVDPCHSAMRRYDRLGFYPCVPYIASLRLVATKKIGSELIIFVCLKLDTMQCSATFYVILQIHLKCTSQ